MWGKVALGPFIRGRDADQVERGYTPPLNSPSLRGVRTRVLHPLNPKYDDIELRRDTEYRIVGVVVEKKKRYR